MMKHPTPSLLLACLGLAACVSNAPPPNPNERSASDLYVLKGVQYMEGGRLDIAQQDLKRAIDLDSHNAEAYNALGVLYERLGQIGDAGEQFKQALSLDEQNVSAADNYGRMLCAHGQYEQGMKYLQKAIAAKLYPSPWLALTNAGICAKSQGMTADAENYLRKALETAPNFAPALLEMARLSLETGNNLSARAFLQRYDAVAEPNAGSLAIGVQAERALGNAKEANAYLKKLLRLYPESKEAQRFHK